MSELDDAIKLANRILDRPNGDPDDDLAVLARQLLRSRERVSALSQWCSFSASVIKSGEPWTSACQEMYDAANPTK